MDFPHKHRKNLKTHSSCNDGSFDNNIHLGWGQEHTSLNVEHSQGVSHINPDSKASCSTEGFTVCQGWSYSELIARWKENVLRASQYSHTAQSLHAVVRGFFFKLWFFAGTLLIVKSHFHWAENFMIVGWGFRGSFQRNVLVQLLKESCIIWVGNSCIHLYC